MRYLLVALAAWLFAFLIIVESLTGISIVIVILPVATRPAGPENFKAIPEGCLFSSGDCLAAAAGIFHL
jgi:hypothetical protein